ncbi:uncharacterized protein J7T54_003007 [Emericellopsis cladophorae]|uniref:Gpr1 family protein n=1 Tax=Emericellopsis cladophorae TaxID=2686198 RepID=A0A9P9XZ88_9HYPO|nr:uncharacterized protein J7T54_003007 [Emericellopsis cladophorae]KAI6780228.1 hypothetical protein J7T54_003007 [Emericellopsis cladophorae]
MSNYPPPQTDEAAAHHDYVNGHDPELGHGAHRSTVSQVRDPQFFKVANPGPLGLISFAITTLCLGFYHLPGANPLGSVGPYQAIFGLAVFFGGGTQFVAGIMEFRVGNTFGSTLHCSYGAFWLSFAMFIVPSLGIREAYAGDERAFTVAVGIFLMAWCLLTLVFTIGALKTNIAILFVLGCLTLAFFFLGLAQFIAVPHPSAAIKVNQVGGAFSVFCALGALYAGASGIMLPESTWVRFPLGEFNYAKPSPAAAAATENGANGKQHA